MNRKKITGLVAGAFAATTVFVSVPSTTLADGFNKLINVYTNIRVHINNQKLPDVNASGNPVSFIYNNTAYVDVDAVGKALGQDVEYRNGNLYVGNGSSTGSDFGYVDNRNITNVNPNVVNYNRQQPIVVNAKYLLDECPPYQTHGGYQVLSEVTIAGKKYTKGFRLNSDGQHYFGAGWALYNLDGKYNTLSFDVGHIDGCDMHGGQIKIYLDKELAATIDLTADMLPMHHDIDLHGARQMKIDMGNGCTGKCYAIINAKIS